MKRPAAIDFAALRRPPWPGWGLAAIAAGLLTANGIPSWRIEQDSRAQAALLKLAQPVQVARPSLSATDRRLLAQARSVANQLNAPWDELLAIFEEHSIPNVGLLKLAPDAKAAVVRVTAQARSTDAMVSYLSALEADSRLAEVLLSNHQIERDTSGHPVRFMLLASWRPLTTVAGPTTGTAKEAR